MFTQQETKRIMEVFIGELNRLQKDDQEYFKYVNAMKQANLFAVTPNDREIIRDFLFKWGHMGRIGRNPSDPKMSLIIQKHAEFLQTVRKQNIHETDFRSDEKTIVTLYEDLQTLVGPISATKTLHLICPGFFPLWDNGIIGAYNSSHRAKNGSELIQMVNNTQNSKRATGDGYYHFMQFTQSFVLKYLTELSQIQMIITNDPLKKSKTLLRIVDEFNMFATKYPFYYLC